MVSELIDELWHTFILFTNDYRKFCDTTVGEYIHHDPNVNAEDRNGPLFISKKKRNIEFFYEEYNICQFGIFAHFLVLLYVGTGLTIANSSSKSGKITRSGGGPLYNIGSSDEGSGCGGGGCGGGCGGGGC